MQLKVLLLTCGRVPTTLLSACAVAKVAATQFAILASQCHGNKKKLGQKGEEIYVYAVHFFFFLSAIVTR